MSGQLPWYIARAAGLMAWALLTASVIWGLAISTKAKAFGRRPRPAWTLDLHRFLGALATIFTAVHVGAILIDTYVKFDLVSVLVPFASSWKPVTGRKPSRSCKLFPRTFRSSIVFSSPIPMD